MFTGIIEELGRVRSLERRGEGVRMTVEARTVTEGTREGDALPRTPIPLAPVDRGLIAGERGVGGEGFCWRAANGTGCSGVDSGVLGRCRNCSRSGAMRRAWGSL